MGKIGLDYFPFTCISDDKLELIESEFGLKGLAIIVKLFQRIYGERGYYCEWNSEVELLFSRKVCSLPQGDNSVSEVINAAIRRGIFDKDKFQKYGILTSCGIQRRFFDAAKRRSNVEVEKSYLLLKVDQIPKNVCVNEENVNINQKNVYRNEQSKVKESKVKESKVKESKVNKESRAFAPPSLEDVKSYCVERKNNIDPEYFIDFYSSKNWMVGRNKMSDWRSCIRVWEKREKEYNQDTTGLNIKLNENKNKFVNYEQREWDFDKLREIEKQFMDKELERTEG